MSLLRKRHLQRLRGKRKHREYEELQAQTECVQTGYGQITDTAAYHAKNCVPGNKNPIGISPTSFQRHHGNRCWRLSVGPERVVVIVG